jgi:hypothetical protein
VEKDRGICLTKQKIETRHFYFASKTLRALRLRRSKGERASSEGMGKRGDLTIRDINQVPVWSVRLPTVRFGSEA